MPRKEDKAVSRNQLRPQWTNLTFMNRHRTLSQVPEIYYRLQRWS